MTEEPLLHSVHTVPLADFAGPVLSENHRRMLQASGLTPEVIRERGYRTVSDKSELLKLGFRSYQALVPCLLIPIWGTGGEIVGHHIRPDSPRAKRNGKSNKYEFPAGNVNRLDVPPGVRHLIGDPKVPLIITEGAKKADSAACRGCCCVGLIGVWNFRGKNEKGGSVAIGDFESLAMKGREVFVAYDSDAVDKVGVRAAEHRLAGFLKSRGAKVRILRIPPRSREEKVGLDDYLVGGGTMEELLAAAIGQDDIEDRPELGVVQLSTIDAQEIAWLWKPYVALGKLTILAGEPGAGKGWIAMALAMSVTTGSLLPRAYPDLLLTPNIGSVLYFSTEDGLADTIRPRMDGMQADVSRVFVSDQPVTLDEAGFEALRAVALEREPDLTVIDPLQSFMGGKIDMHRANETRPFLQRLKSLAEEIGCAVVVLCHISKSSGSRRAVFSVLGSIDIAGAARSVLLVGQDDEASNPKEMRLVGGVVHVKSNIGPRGPSIGFQVDRGEFSWGGHSEMTEFDVLGGGPRSSETTPITDAKEFLLEALKDGPTIAKSILKDAEGQGIATRTLHRAKLDLGVRSSKVLKGQPGYPGWRWEIDSGDKGNVPRLPTLSIEESGNLDSIQVPEPARVGSSGNLYRPDLEMEEIA